MKALGENLFQAFLLASGVASSPLRSLAGGRITPVSACLFTWPAPLCVSGSFFLL